MWCGVDGTKRTVGLRRSVAGAIGLLLVLTGCASDAPDSTNIEMVAADDASERVEASAADAVCAVTVPPSEPFVPPNPWPAVPSSDDFVWYGSDDLWTVLEVGPSQENKSVWWSANFTNAEFESWPEIVVVFERLDVEADPVVFASPGTNAFSPEDQLFMINGFEPRDPGCWQATATYKGATLQYVYFVPEGTS